MAHRTVRGEIAYTSRKPGREGQGRGREWFHFTHHRDGAAVLSAHCEIEEPEPTVMRDIVYALDGEGRPRHVHVQLTVGDAPMGSGWFRVVHRKDGGTVECEADSAATGRLSQALAFAGALDGFGTHPIVGDGYLTRCMDVSRGPHRRRIRVFVPSPDHRGATPPMAHEVTIGLAYLGDETVTVAAGTFACRHFAFVDDEGPGMGGTEHPRYDLWVTADADAVFVQGGVGGYMATWYELVSLTRPAPFEAATARHVDAPAART